MEPTMRTFKVTLLFLASMFLASLMGAPAPQAIDIYPRISGPAPATVRYRLTIEPDATNRAYCTGYVGTQSRESCRELEGDKGWRTQTDYWRDLPGGRYEAFLTVIRVSEKGVKTSQTVHTPFCIVGGLGEAETSCADPTIE